MRSSEGLIQAWWKGKRTSESEIEIIGLGNNVEDRPSPPIFRSLQMGCAEAAIPRCFRICSALGGSFVFTSNSAESLTVATSSGGVPIMVGSGSFSRVRMVTLVQGRHLLIGDIFR